MSVEDFSALMVNNMKTLIMVDRYIGDKDSTLSRLSIEREQLMYGCEDAYRSKKVYGKTCIPEGLYDVGVRVAGGSFNPGYYARYPDMHKGMLHILDVPDYEWIYIHPGNTHLNTKGCYLPGMDPCNRGGELGVTDSVDAYKMLYALVIDKAIAGNLRIMFKNHDLKDQLHE